MLSQISIIGCGNIGRRHLQSCLNLGGSAYEITILEPQELMVEKARAMVGASNTNVSVSFVSSIEDLPELIDVAIIATSSDVREDIVAALLKLKAVKYLILEKFLFQSANAYEHIGSLIARTGVPTYVNCPTRIWPVFQTLAQVMRGETVTSIQYDSVGGDIGCNGIHMLDLLSFLVGSENYEIERFQLLDYRPAKRAGYLKLAGILNGAFRVHGRTIPFQITAPEGEYAGGVTSVELAGKGPIQCREDGANVVVSGAGAPPTMLQTDWAAPYQSTLTSMYVERLIADGEIGLPTYNTSMRMHLSLLKQFLNALNAEGVLDDPLKCPIT